MPDQPAPCKDWPCPHPVVFEGSCAWHAAEKLLPFEVWLSLSDDRNSWRRERADYIKAINAARLNIPRSEAALVARIRSLVHTSSFMTSYVLAHYIQDALDAWDIEHGQLVG